MEIDPDMRFLFRLLANAAALWTAVQVVPGIQHHGTVLALLGVALIFGVINAIVKPVLLLLSLPLLLVTLGLFTLVLNAMLLWLTSSLSAALGLGFHVSGFAAAFLGAIVVSLVSIALSLIID
jgi:putative membrane protein